MGGQFPTENDHSAFKKPIFYTGKFFEIPPKNELSEFDGSKMTFYTVFVQTNQNFSARCADCYRIRSVKAMVMAVNKKEQNRKNEKISVATLRGAHFKTGASWYAAASAAQRA